MKLVYDNPDNLQKTKAPVVEDQNRKAIVVSTPNDNTLRESLTVSVSSNSKFTTVPLGRSGQKFIIADLDSNLFDKLKQDVQEAFEIKIKHNSRLVGHIKEEYAISPCIEFKNYIMEMLIEFTGDHTIDSDICDFSQTWVNFQKKAEFNPAHVHQSMYSYVVWINLPFKIEDEYALFPDVNEPATSNFIFIYHDPDSPTLKLHNIEADKRYEGKIILFPSTMMHSVYPFYTSDEYRISLAGNVDILPGRKMPDEVKKYFDESQYPMLSVNLNNQ